MSRGRVVHMHAANRLYVDAWLKDGGELVIEAQDLTGAWGVSEYEYALTVPAAAIPTIVAALGGGEGDDVLDLLAQHGEEIVAHGERRWLTTLGVEPELWSRMGD